MTAILHDPRQRRHNHPGHPERPERIETVMTALDRAHLLDQLSTAELREVTRQELDRVHHAKLLQHIAQVTDQGGGRLDPDTFCTDQSWELARDGAGGLIDLCRAVARGEETNGLALLRPPGHHATATSSMGFCLVNHVALAARALQDVQLAEKVAIVDIDVHHGNGTEDIFAADPTVFFASTHQFPHYPGTGRAADRGLGRGEGFTLNVPLPAGTGDEVFLAAYMDTILPAVEDFQPDFLLVSLGYDAHGDDPLAGLMLTDGGYAEISRLLVELAGRVCAGKVVFNLEGGYNLDVLARCVPSLLALLLESGSRKAQS